MIPRSPRRASVRNIRSNTNRTTQRTLNKKNDSNTMVHHSKYSTQQDIPQSQANAIVHLHNLHDGNSYSNSNSELQRVFSRAESIICSLEPSLVPALVTSRLEQLRMLVVEQHSVFPIWDEFEKLTSFCANYQTTDQLVLTSELQLLRTILDISRQYGVGQKQPHQNFAQCAVNAPTLPSIFVACLRLLPLVTVTTEHAHQSCRHMAHSTLHTFLTFSRDAPSGILHRLGILTAQPSGAIGTYSMSALRMASARTLYEILCTTRYWPDSKKPPYFDEAQFYSAVRSLVTSLRDPDTNVTGVVENVLASMRHSLNNFHECVQKLPLDLQDTLHSHINAIDRKSQQLEDDQHQQSFSGVTTGAVSTSGSIDRVQLGFLPKDAVNAAIDKHCPVNDRLFALKSISEHIDCNLSQQHQCIMYDASKLQNVVLLLLQTIQSTTVTSAAIEVAISAMRILRRLIRFVGIAIKPFVGTIIYACVQRFRQDLISSNTKPNMSNKESETLQHEVACVVHCLQRTVGPNDVVMSVLQPTCAASVTIQLNNNKNDIDNAVNTFLLDVLHFLLRQAGWALDVPQCTRLLAPMLDLASSGSAHIEKLLQILDTLWSINPSLDFLGIVGSCHLRNTDAWMKKLFDRKQMLMRHYLDKDLENGDDLPLAGALGINKTNSSYIHTRLQPESNPKMPNPRKVKISPISTKKPSVISSDNNADNNNSHTHDNYTVRPETMGSSGSYSSEHPCNAADERPIKPMAQGSLSYSDVELDADIVYDHGKTLSSSTPTPAKVSAVTQKRLKRLAQKQQQQALNDTSLETRMPSSTPIPAKHKDFLKRSTQKGKKIAQTPGYATSTSSISKRRSLDSRDRSNSSNAGGLFKEKEYLNENELQPLSGNAAKKFEEIRTILSNGKTDWSDTFKALDTMRRIAAHHGAVVSKQDLHAVLLRVLDAINNLRSSVSKNGLLCLGDMFGGLRRRMDPEISTVLPHLLKKCADTNKFVNAEALKVMDKMRENCSPGRVLGGLVKSVGQPYAKDSRVRAMVARFLWATLHFQLSISGALRGVLRSELLSSVCYTLIKLATDASSDTRQQAVGGLWTLIDGGIPKQELLSSAPTNGQLQKMLAKGRPVFEIPGRNNKSNYFSQPNGIHQTPGKKTIPRSSRVDGDRNLNIDNNAKYKKSEKAKPGRNVRRTLNAVTAKIEEISKAWVNLNSWRERLENLIELTELVKSNPSAIQSKLFVTMDLYRAAISDGNLKVSAKAVELLTEIIPLFGPAISKVLHLLMPLFCQVAGARQSNMQELCRKLLVAIFSLITPAQGIVALGNSVDKYCKTDLAKMLLITQAKSLIEGAGATGNDGSSSLGKAVQKKLIPLAYRLLSASSGSLRVEVEHLLKVLYRTNRAACEEHHRQSTPRTAKMVTSMLLQNVSLPKSERRFGK